MHMSNIAKTIAFTVMTSLSANAAMAQNCTILCNALPVEQGYGNNFNAGNAVGALIALGLVAGAVHTAHQPRVQNVRLQCPAGTRPHATAIGSGHGGLIHDGYRWVCAY